MYPVLPVRPQHLGLGFDHMAQGLPASSALPYAHRLSCPRADAALLTLPFSETVTVGEVRAQRGWGLRVHGVPKGQELRLLPREVLPALVLWCPSPSGLRGCGESPCGGRAWPVASLKRNELTV